eukprot:TRINITY_DN27459_c0_g1_i2.p1 TRINITY_DN27459_c0_g1~~TRINITY_DN27459_c0_g1_i2.p1  ORF type:complete len:651 (-),score=109.85 TRINITY_DN27459_c0_g1_i2:77-1960(-)
MAAQAQRQSRSSISARIWGSTTNTAVLGRLLAASSQWKEEPQMFLDELDSALQTLKIKECDRSYRSGFSENYKALFARSPRLYSSELLEVCEAKPIVVNGIVYDLTPATVAKAAAVVQCVDRLLELLRNWSARSILRSAPQVKPLLETFDKTWVLLEDNYIRELMSIEEKAREPLAVALKLEQELRQLETCYVSDFQPRKQRTKLCLPIVPASSGQRPPCSGRQRKPSDAQSPCARQRHPSGASDAQSPCSKQRQPSEVDSECASLCHSAIPESPCSRQRQVSTELPSISVALQLEEPASSFGKAAQSHIRRLARSASSRCGSKRVRAAMEDLFAQVCRLNAYRGRENIEFEVLEAAADAYLSSEQGVGSECNSAARSSLAAQQLLASTVLSSFVHLREHLSKITNIMRIDPQLSNNASLMQRLAAFEESCELGAQFLMKPDLLNALCSVAAEAAGAKHDAPEFRTILEDQDADLFLILPRLVLLRGLASPSHAALVEVFLPHHFGSPASDDQAGNSSTKQGPSEQMQCLMKDFERASEMLGTVGGYHQRTLVRRAVLGFQAEGQGDVDGAVDRFMLRLEGFSMELQRYRPRDWNRCCSILLQCIEAASNAALPSRRAGDCRYVVSL